jgi:hypothetical protein
VGAAEHPAPLTVATLCAYHDDRDPDELREILNLIPTSVRSAEQSPAKPIPNGWFVEIGGPSARIEDQIRALLAVIASREAQIAEASALGWKLEVRCYAQTPPHQVVTFSPEELALLGRCGLSLQLFVS